MSGQQSSNTLHENAIGWGILLVVLGVLVWLFWYYFDVEVRNMVRWIRYAEMWLISLVVGDDYTVTLGGRTVNWQQGFEDTAKWKPEKLRYEHLSYFSALAMQPLRPVFAGICFAAAGWALFYGPQTQYRKKLDLSGLIGRQAHNFPVISPFVDFNPSTQPPRPPGAPVPAELPLFAEALSPEEWLAYYSIPAPDGKINPDAAAKAFQKQLLGRWKGPQALAPYQQILFAAFCLKASRKRKDADAMLGRIAKCWTFKDGLNLNKDKKLLKEAREIIRNKKLSGVVLENANRHAFVTTAMLRALETARKEGGVMAPAQFVWLRAHDRMLFYPLNNLGRRSFHMEALGAMSHYRAEKMTQRPIPVAKIEDAVTSIVDYVASGKVRPIPPLDYSNSKKKGVKKAV